MDQVNNSFLFINIICNRHFNRIVLAPSTGLFAGGQSYAGTNFGHGGGVASVG